MLERESLETCELTVGEGAIAVWVVKVGRGGGHTPCLGVAIVGGAVALGRTVNVVVGPVVGNIGDGIVDGWAHLESDLGNGGVCLFWEFWQYFPRAVGLISGLVGRRCHFSLTKMRLL